MGSFQQSYLEANRILKAIKTCNDELARQTAKDLPQLRNQLAKDEAFIRSQALKLNNLLREMEQGYLDPGSAQLVASLKADSKKHIKRNEYLLQQLVQETIKNNLKEVNHAQQIEMTFGKQQQYKQKDKVDSDRRILLEIQKEKAQVMQDVQKAMQSIHGVMGDIENMVERHGQQLDLIEDNIKNTNRNVLKAAQNISQANKYHEKGRNWIWLVVVLIALLILTLIVLSLSL